MRDRIRTEIVDHVAHVQMVRTDKMNAVDGAMFDALIDAGKRLRQETDLRAVVLSGEGRAFCAGIDLTTLSGDAGDVKIEMGARIFEGMNILQYCAMQWRLLPVPVIAAIHDIAYGAGFQLALGADMRFVAPAARCSIMEIKWGLVPDMAAMHLLRGLVRPDIAAELIFSGRVFSGVEAERLGLATRLSKDPAAEALAFAKEIAGRSPDAIRAGKRLLSLQDDRLRDRILLAESIEQEELLRSPNHAEALRSGLAQEQARFGPAQAAPFIPEVGNDRG